MDNSLEKVLESLELIKNKMNDIELRLSTIETSCKGMDNHISLVEKTYNSIRNPLNYFIKNKNKELPGLEN
jgi:archaellum component FlaC